MGYFLGIDTSNYTTSVAIYHPQTNTLLQEKKKLAVKDGQVGLRQGDAVFEHVKQLSGLIENLARQAGPFRGVGVSVRPRDAKDSYMPCFMVGQMVAQSAAALLDVPLYQYSHQSGHIAAALYGACKLDLLEKPFGAFHLSGGTTESFFVEPHPKKVFQLTPVAQTLDLYAGQGVDRVGRLLGLPFPAGPALEKLAQGSQMTYQPAVFFRDGQPSLSGLENKAQLLLSQGTPASDVAKFTLDFILSMVKTMTKDMKKKAPLLPILYAGGVMSNKYIQTRIREEFGGYFAPPEFSADNGAGVAVLAAYEAMKGER